MTATVPENLWATRARSRDLRVQSAAFLPPLAESVDRRRSSSTGYVADAADEVAAPG
jgi:hypothetical protein